MTPERRRWMRQATDDGLAVTLTADGWSRPCLIMDIAPGGAELRLTGAPPRNREVRLYHRAAGTLYATRVWADAHAMGLAFDDIARAQDFLSRCQLSLDGWHATGRDRHVAQAQSIPLPA